MVHFRKNDPKERVVLRNGPKEWAVSWRGARIGGSRCDAGGAVSGGRVPRRGVGPQPGQAELHGTQRATADSRVGAVSQSD